MVARKGGKGGGKKGKGAGRGRKPAPPPAPDDMIIDFTPSAGFDIRTAVQGLLDLMEDLQQPLVIRLPGVSVEFEYGCTRKEIIDGYNRALKVSMTVKPANVN